MSRLTLAWSVESAVGSSRLAVLTPISLAFSASPLQIACRYGLPGTLMTHRMFFEPALARRSAATLPTSRALLTDEAERAVSLPLVLSRLVDIDGNARRDRLLDVGIDHAGDEIADDDGVGVLRDRRLHGPRRSRLDVGLVDRDVVQLHPERLGRVLGPLVQGREK